MVITCRNICINSTCTDICTTLANTVLTNQMCVINMVNPVLFNIIPTLLFTQIHLYTSLFMYSFS